MSMYRCWQGNDESYVERIEANSPEEAAEAFCEGMEMDEPVDEVVVHVSDGLVDVVVDVHVDWKPVFTGVVRGGIGA